MFSLSLFIGKIVALVITRILHRAGGTWPGEFVCRWYAHALGVLLARVQDDIILVAGTNGKTTTTSIIYQMVKNGKKLSSSHIVYNISGANLINGLVSAFLQKISWTGASDIRFAVFEVDENTLPLVLHEISLQKKLTAKVHIVLLNLFRDQLDRYGEVDSISKKWKQSLSNFSSQDHISIQCIANADDPVIAGIASDSSIPCCFFGISKPELFLKDIQHTADSIRCFRCGGILAFDGVYFSHLGYWTCLSCGSTRPPVDTRTWHLPLHGLYNEYNVRAAVEVAKQLNLSATTIDRVLKSIQPAFGRQEKITYQGRVFHIYLAKNPAGFDAALTTVLSSHPRYLLLCLNDQIPDGRDVSWIWDTDMERIPENVRIVSTGDRAYDMGVRALYAREENLHVSADRSIPSIRKAVAAILSDAEERAHVSVLATYSAMLEVRHVLIGRSIL